MKRGFNFGCKIGDGGFGAGKQDLSVICILSDKSVRSVKTEVVDINRKQQGAKSRSLKNPLVNGSRGRDLSFGDRHALRVAREVVVEPRSVDSIELEFF